MNSTDNSNQQGANFKVRTIRTFIIVAVVSGILWTLKNVFSSDSQSTGIAVADTSSVSIADLFAEVWTAPDSASIPQNDSGKAISYGRRLVIHTAAYFGPKGSISHTTNGLSCQNCHLDAGTRPFGNNFGAVAAIYPKYLPRKGEVETIAGKVNECFLRSLNGTEIDTQSKEMRAIVAYIEWLGKDVKKGKTPEGCGGIKPPHMIDRAADPQKGEPAFDQHCSRCHGKDGQGQLAIDVLKDETKQQGGNATTDDLYYYPPLWGDQSYNGIATLYRLSKFAGFIKDNMPYPVSYKNSVLTDEQAWDIAAYVNSRNRPTGDHSKDYATDISQKPFDFPFGPYADNYTEEQHKFGPYADIQQARRKK